MKNALWMVMCLLVLPAAIWFGLREWQRTKGAKATATVAGAAAAAKANPQPSGVMGNVPQQIQTTATQVAQTVSTVASAASEVVDVARNLFGGGGGSEPAPAPAGAGDFADSSAFDFGGVA